MKIGILFTLSWISLTALGQSTSEKQQTIVIYQDSVEMPQHAYWDRSESENFLEPEIVKSSQDPNKVIVYFRTEKPRDAQSYNFLELKQIEHRYTGSQKRNTLFLLNNKLVTRGLDDPKIDSSFIHSVDVIYASEIAQSIDLVNEFAILNVKLDSKYWNSRAKQVNVSNAPKFYFAPVEKKEIKPVLPSEYVKSKEAKTYHFLTPKDIEEKYTGTTSKSTLFFLNEELLTRPNSHYQIDSSYLYKVEVLASTNIDYLKDTLPVFTILRISLATPENVAPKIYIRGSRTAMKE